MDSEPEGISKTKIMQNVMLNYKRVNRYCAQMMEAGMLSYARDSPTFHITDKGRIMLRDCKELAVFISPINNLIQKYRFVDSNIYEDLYINKSRPNKASILE